MGPSRQSKNYRPQTLIIYRHYIQHTQTEGPLEHKILISKILLNRCCITLSTCCLDTRDKVLCVAEEIHSVTASRKRAKHVSVCRPCMHKAFLCLYPKGMSELAGENINIQAACRMSHLLRYLFH